MRRRCRWNPDRVNFTEIFLSLGEELLPSPVAEGVDVIGCGESAVSVATGDSSDTASRVSDAFTSCLGMVPGLGIPLDIAKIGYELLDGFECIWERSGEYIDAMDLPRNYRLIIGG
jgi:hypothetical protein